MAHNVYFMPKKHNAHNTLSYDDSNNVNRTSQRV